MPLNFGGREQPRFFSMGLSSSAVMKSEYYFSSGRQPSRLPD
ncbi:hypothetical protein CLS_10610 [[Clostridium] cf. saccharolyticum K10]|nr:hypothetical protein CLS_10610 [[Clostridium] cf. saccharolyticum K10]